MRNTVNCMIGKTKVKFNVIRDWDGDVRGYALGEYKLVKHYGWGNSYSWVIVKRANDVAAADCDFWRQYNNNELEIVSSCKSGKERLVDLYIEDVRLW